jgi:hypothetical protein
MSHSVRVMSYGVHDICQCASVVRTADAAKASHELAALLALVGDDLERGTERLVVVREPLQQWLTLHQLQLYATLHTTQQLYNDL